MMRLEIESAVFEITQRVGRIPLHTTARVAEECEKSAVMVANIAKRSVMKGPKTGEVYKRGQGGKGKKKPLHQASAPGQPPATDTGGLASSIVSRAKALTAEAGAFAKHGVWMEEGTERVSPRPFIEPALKAVEVGHVNRMVRALRAAANEA